MTKAANLAALAQGPAFSAYQNAGQTLSNATWTKYQLQVEEFDTSNCFDNATNYRFTPTVAGYYLLTGNVSLTNVNGELLAAIYKNGAPAKYGSDMTSANMYMQQITALVYLNGSTDYVELWAFQSTGASKTTGTEAPLRGYFQGFLARAA